MLFSADVFLLLLMSSLYLVILFANSATALMLIAPSTFFGMIALKLNGAVKCLHFPFHQRCHLTAREVVCCFPENFQVAVVGNNL